jgi:hypothetical protein
MGGRGGAKCDDGGEETKKRERDER